MKTVRILMLLVGSLLIAASSHAAPKDDTAYVNKLLKDSKALFGEDPNKALALAQQAQTVADKINFKEGKAYALKNIGIVYYMQQNFSKALEYWDQSLSIFREIKNDIGIANILNNISGVYLDQGVDTKALEYALQSLQVARKTGDKKRIMSALTNIGSIYHVRKDPKALGYLLEAKPLCLEVGTDDEKALLLGDIGEVYFDLGEMAGGTKESSAAIKYLDQAVSYFNNALSIDNSSARAAYSYNGVGKSYLKEGNYKLALQNHSKALAIAEKLDDKLEQVPSLRGLANTYAKQKNFTEAISYYLKAQKIAEEINSGIELRDLYYEAALAYEAAGDLKNALKFKSLYAAKQKEVYDSETEKQLGRIDLTSQLDIKKSEVKAQEAESNRQKQAKVAFAIGLGLILIIAVIIFRNYLNKAKINRVLDKQKGQIEDLLHNILPVEVAKELQDHGAATPRHYNNVSVLFTDFKGFTTIADKMSPQELVTELSACFVAFDEIVGKYGLEKIKTIGDAYMCAGGIPTEDPEHPFKITRAALEIQDYIHDYNERRQQQGLETWEIRIGMHVGPVVAGVVGKRKYAYDIWGSTVNVASRMESNGAAGKVNISSAAYEIIKDQFSCTYRGKIHAKNVGEIDMYFVEGEKDIITYAEAVAGVEDDEPLLETGTAPA